MNILNLTQHVATQSQHDAGVVEPPSALKAKIKELLDFQEAPTQDEMKNRALLLAELAESLKATSVMIGGAPFFMSTLEDTLDYHGISPCYSFSVRNSVEVTQEDGSVRKVSEFQHLEFFWPETP